MNRHAKAPSSGSGTRQDSRRVPKLLLAGAVLALTLVLGATSASAVAPVVTPPTATAVEYTTAHLAGEVNPEDHDTNYWFEYTTQATYEAEGNSFANANQTNHELLAEGAGLTPVQGDLTGLAPNTTYHLRLVAENTEAEQVEAVAASTFETKAVAKPTVSVDPVTTFTDSSAHLVGQVNPNAPEPEGSTSPAEDAAFETSWHFECVAPGPSCGALSGVAVPAGNAAKAVEADATGLEPNTAYYVKLVASNLGGTEEAATAANPSFTTPTPAPTVKAWAAGPVGPTSADLNAQVNPHNSPTTYWFEWGTSDCTANPCQAIPAVKADAGSGHLFVYATEHLSGLTPSTTYHFRLLAENASGPTAGPDETFTTAAPAPTCANAGMPGTATLPDCRGYEMVSPPDKNGADVVLQSYKTFAAADGNGVSYPTLAAFGDVRGTSTDVQYLSRRTAAPGTNGWSTHGINPLGGAPTVLPLVFSNVPSFEYAFTPDLSGAIYKSWRPLTDAPNVAGVTNLYRIRDLDAGAPTPQLLTDSAEPLADVGPFLKLIVINALDAASKDLSHVVFQSPWNLTTDGGFTGFTGGNLYEYADGVGVRAVGRVPVGPATECDDGGGSPCTDAPGAQTGFTGSINAGVSSSYSDGMISDDGARILFRTPSGAIYLREDGERTYQLNASEKTTPETPNNAGAWAMSADGSRVFLTTGEGLVDGDDDGLPDLYMYEVAKPAGSRLTLVSVDKTGGTPFVGGVVGTSADGHYVYFTSDGQLVPGEPSGVGRGLYMWHDGTIAYIGKFADENETARNVLGAAWNYFTNTRTSRVTPDGRFLLFTSNSDAGFAGRGGYPGYDHGSCDYGGAAPCRELFLYSADSGKLRCVSCNPRAAVATGDALPDVHAGASASAPTAHFSQALSEDGRYVFFNTVEALVSEDSNGRWDAYEYDSLSGELHLISSGTDSADSYVLDESPDGRDVFFATRERLVGWDVDDAYDLYDARVGGGLPEPVPAPAPCSGDPCHGAPSAAPGDLDPASANFAGPGDRKPGRRCAKGRRQVRHQGKVRCIKKHGKHGKRANANRRAGR